MIKPCRCHVTGILFHIVTGVFFDIVNRVFFDIALGLGCSQSVLLAFQIYTGVIFRMIASLFVITFLLKLQLILLALCIEFCI